MKARGEVSLSLGTDDYYRTAIDINEPLSDGAAFRLAAFAQDVQTTRDVVHNKDFGFAPSLRLGIGSDTELNFSALIQRNNDIPDYGFPLLRSDNTANSVAKPAAAPAHNFYGYLDDHYDQDVNVLTADVKHRLSDTFSINSRTQYSQYRVTASPSPLSAAKTLSGGTPYLDTPLGEIVASRQDKDRTIDDYSLSNQTDVIAKLRSGSIQHTLTSGFELGIDHYLNNYYTWDTSSDDRLINLAYPVNGTREGTRYRSRNTDVTATTVAAYANDQIDLTSEWKLIVGLRWDRFDTDAQQLGYLADGGIDTSSSSRGPASYDAARVDTMVSKRLGLIWQPTESQSYYVAYGTSFNPSAEAVALSAADEDVAPEKNESYEIGAKYDLLEGNLQLNAALFQIEKTNAQTNDPISGALTLDGDTRVRGFEINAVGHLTPNWQILAGYTRLDGEVVDSYDSTTLTTDAGTATVYAKGKTLQNTPENNVTLWTTYTVFDVWEIGGGMLYVDDRYVNNYETAMVDGYTRYDATLAYRQPKFDVRLNLQNLTDKTYFDVASGGRATPANGRTLILTTTYRF